jgi:ABC-2 type transport system ATP-binding protein
MIEARGLTKRYGDTLAVDDLSFEVLPGRVTGFLGPNGAGKSTTMRMILGLDRPSGGSVTVNGHRYAEIGRPVYEVGALLDAKAIHGGRSAYNHLLCLAQSNGIPRKRIDEVIEMVGLSSVAKKRAGKFSLGMGQRLGIAAALLGDPDVLLFDEPVNGLDPEGILWIRNLLKYLATQGRTVFVSSHLMSEMAVTADHLIVIGRGRLIADLSVDEFIQQSSQNFVRVRSPRLQELAQFVERAGGTTSPIHDPSVIGGAVAMSVTGLAIEAIGDLAAANGLPIHELAAQTASLEAAFMELTRDSVDYHGGYGTPPAETPPGTQPGFPVDPWAAGPPPVPSREPQGRG